MKNYSRIFYYFVIGATGGLTGWFVGTLVSTAWVTTPQTVFSEILYGAILGGIIGVAVAAYDGIMNRSLPRFIKYGSIGLALGSVGGALALPLAQRSYAALLSGGAGANDSAWQNILVGTFCWLLFGALVGLGECISKGTQSWKGLLGGLTGGLVGGLLYEFNRSFGPGNDPFRYQLFLALSLLLMGAAISVAITFVTTVLRRAWMEVLSGKLTGHPYDVTKYVDPKLGSFRSGIIGSDRWKAHVYLPADDDVLPRHAEIHFSNGAPTITVSPEASKRAITFVNGRRLMATSPLSDGDELQFGSTKLLYRQKRR